MVAIADFDSFLRAASVLASTFEDAGAAVSYRVAHARGGQLSEAQLRACGLSSAHIVIDKIERIALSSEVRDADVVLLALNGARTRQFMVAFHAEGPPSDRRPMVVSFYPGILFRFHLEGMMSRSSADLLLLNSPADLELYRQAMMQSGLDASNATVHGLAMLPPRTEADAHQVPPKGDLVFVGQPTVPAGRLERMYTARRMVDLARANPERRVVIKPRHRPSETTLHRMKFHYADLLEALAEPIPDNLEISYESMPSLLERAAVVVTYSSTAAIEAAVRGIPTRVLTDLGVHENIGNHFFLGSDMLGTFDDVSPTMPYRLNEAWRRTHVVSARDHDDDLLGRLDEMLHTQADAGTAKPRPNPGLFSRAPAYEAFVVPREGLRALVHFGLVKLSQSPKAFARRQLVTIRRSVASWIQRTVRR